jgi:NTE family protein
MATDEDDIPEPEFDEREIHPSFGPASPVDEDPSHSGDRGPRPGTALCLSGGGYRAMLFHVGALWRMNEIGYLPRLNRISSVSGGSITAGALAVAWPKLDFRNGVAAAFVDEFVARVRGMATHTIDVSSVIRGAVLPGTIAEKVANAYDRHLYNGATLQDLPDEVEGVAPRFIFNASNVQSGALFRFSKPYIWDWRVGKIERPRERLALAVAASSAFPPVLSPLTLEYEHGDYTPGTGRDLQQPPYTTRPVLTDGGVYDNLGLETAWKRYRTILVSDAGGRMAAEGSPKRDPIRHMRRVLDLIDNQVRSLRKRQVIDGYQLPRDGGKAWRDGTYWGIRTDIADYGLPDALPCPYEATMRIAAEPTRLAKMAPDRQERLINWGYAVCDAAMRRWVLKEPPARPPAFPYANAGVG